MDPRTGRRIIRDRWGEPIVALKPHPKGQKRNRWLPRLFGWWRGN